ncbi:ferritin-like domain-containing protein [Thermosphaera sp.]|uniref:Ferritin-like domain-containing protein n=1 Tax=Thermosphaera aggregans TaxID=54254 RepID=A0A7C2BK92_9CREN
MKDSEQSALFREMSRKEKEYSDKLLSTIEKFKHPVLAAVFSAVGLDSLKHSRLYESLAKLVESESPFLTEEEYREIEKSIDEHIKLEAEMVRLTKELLDKAKDSRMKLILEAIHKDEIIHHQLLVSIKDKIARKETFTEETMWDAIWKESPWHGTPGG